MGILRLGGSAGHELVVYDELDADGEVCLEVETQYAEGDYPVYLDRNGRRKLIEHLTKLDPPTD